MFVRLRMTQRWTCVMKFLVNSQSTGVTMFDCTMKVRTCGVDYPLIRKGQTSPAVF